MPLVLVESIITDLTPFQAVQLQLSYTSLKAKYAYYAINVPTQAACKKL